MAGEQLNSEGNAIGCVSKQGLNKASLINDSFISEVKSRRRWRARRRSGCLSPPRKLHSKNISKCISKMVL